MENPDEIYSGNNLINNPSAVMEYWSQYYREGKFKESLLRSYWKIQVPQFFMTSAQSTDSVNTVNNEDSITEFLLDPLEQFICQGKPKVTFEKLQNFNTNPSACGMLLCDGEPTYSCQDCALDQTCVLCSSCFHNSEHRHHRYKMRTSNGNGMCDCGDVEAWKQSPWCTIHAAKITSDDKSINDPLLQNLLSRCTVIFTCVLRYSYEMLTCYSAADLPADLHPASWDLDCNAKNYATVLYNDETHTYEQVIQVLMQAVGCTHKEAVELATATDREGRCVVKVANQQNCTDVKLAVERQTGRAVGRPLKVAVTSVLMLMHQMFVLKLLAWLQKLLGLCVHLCQPLREAFTQCTSKENSITLLESVLLSDTKFWKGARLQWQRLFITGFMTEPEGKKLFAQLFTRHYGKIMSDFIEDDHDYSVSVTSQLVQVYTVPTLAHQLMAEENVLAVLLQILLAECVHYCNAENRLSFGRHPVFNSFRRALLSLFDVEHILSVLPNPWTNELRRGFLSGVTQLLKILSMMQVAFIG